jgi:glycosyl transferase family 25
MNSEAGVYGIYVVHGITGYENREVLLDKVLNKQYGLSYELVTEYSDSFVNEQLIKKYFKEGMLAPSNNGALFCTLVHILIYEKIIQNNNRFALIFENDVCLIGTDFLEKLGLVVNEAKQLEEGFIISIENTTLEFPSWRIVKKGKYLYEAFSGRCAGAYLIDKKAAEIMINDAINIKCGNVIDWWHNDLIDRKIVKMYWAHPPLTE